MPDRSLLVIAHSYANFVKDPLEKLAPAFDVVNVLVRTNPLADVSNYLPIGYLKPFSTRAKIDLAHVPANVRVRPTPIFYLPTDSGYRKLAGRHFRAADKAIRKNRMRFGLVHAHFLLTSGYAGAKIKEKYGVPLVVTAHGIDIYDLPFRDGEQKERTRYVLDTADHIITVSNKNLEYLRKLGVRRPVTVIPNGFDSGIFRPTDTEAAKRALGLPADKKIILAIGLMYEEKGHKYLVEAVREVTRHRKDVICIIIGEGKLRTELARQIRSAGLEGHVRLVGMKGHREIPAWINACDLFALPSLHEGNPTVMFECLGCGKPFIGTPVGGVPEVIAGEDYGLLSEPEDARGLAANLLDGLDKKWDSRAIRRYAEQFTWDDISRKIADVYARYS